MELNHIANIVIDEDTVVHVMKRASNGMVLMTLHNQGTGVETDTHVFQGDWETEGGMRAFVKFLRSIIEDSGANDRPALCGVIDVMWKPARKASPYSG